MAILKWKVLLLVICSVLLVLNEALWQWRLDTTGVGVTSCSGIQILVRNDNKAAICKPCPICSEDMILSPPCGSILTQDTAIECRPPLTKVLMGSKNVNWTALPSLDVSYIYEEGELKDSDSDIADSFLSPTQQVQGVTTVTPPTQTSFSNTFHRRRQRRVNRIFPTDQQATPRPPIARPPVAAKTWSEKPVPEQTYKGSSNFTASSQDVIISCVLGGFLGTSLSLTCLLLGSVLFQKLRGWYTSRLNGTELPESEDEEMLYFGQKEDYMTTTSTSNTVASVNLKHLNLSEMPPDLEYLLVKNLDVRCRGERRYGWQKVGAAFKISKDDLEYLKIEYKRANGSPTSMLLAILGTKGKTVSDLDNVLRSPKVKLPKVASLIRRHIRETNKFQ